MMCMYVCVGYSCITGPILGVFINRASRGGSLIVVTVKHGGSVLKGNLFSRRQLLSFSPTNQLKVNVAVIKPLCSAHAWLVRMVSQYQRVLKLQVNRLPMKILSQNPWLTLGSGVIMLPTRTW